MYASTDIHVTCNLWPWRQQTMLFDLIQPCGSKYLVQAGGSKYLTEPNRNKYLIQPNGNKYLIKPNGNKYLIQAGGGKYNSCSQLSLIRFTDTMASKPAQADG